MFKIEYLVSLFTFYLRGEISVDDYFIRFHRPNTLFGLVGTGYTDTSVPVGQAASVSRHFGVRFGQLLAALLLTAAGILILCFRIKWFWIALILLVFAVNALLQALVMKVKITFLSGQSVEIPFMLFEHGKAVRTEQAVAGLLAQKNGYPSSVSVPDGNE